MALESIKGSIGISTNLQLKFDGIAQTRAQTNSNLIVETTSGSGDDQFNLVYYKKITVTASGSSNLNLTDSSLEDAEGNGLVFTTVKAFSIANEDTTDTIDWSLSGNFLTANNLGTATYHEKAGKSEMDMRNGWAVGANNTITITNNDTVDLDLIIFIGGV